MRVLEGRFISKGRLENVCDFYFVEEYVLSAAAVVVDSVVGVVFSVGTEDNDVGGGFCDGSVIVVEEVGVAFAVVTGN